MDVEGGSGSGSAPSSGHPPSLSRRQNNFRRQEAGGRRQEAGGRRQEARCKTGLFVPGGGMCLAALWD